ncbi:MAG: SPOR domain-containing protein [Candidatus Omnitrophica bacterium]|nr:SPOR domain-containing protein [Candidatus Omnitrophota bacterium]
MGYESQFELFPDSAKQASQSVETRYQLKSLTVTAENIIVLCIIFVVTGVICFSVGVERGKNVAVQDFVSGSSPKETALPVVPKPISANAENLELLAASRGPVDSSQSRVKTDKPQGPMRLAEVNTENVYTVQVASYQQGGMAQKAASNLKGATGQETFVMNKGKHVIVCVGKFDGKQAALQFTSKLKKKYKDCLVRRI